MNYYLGIEFGSTRIKSVIINENFEMLSVSYYEWNNKLVDGYWSYSEQEIFEGLRLCCEKNLDTFEEKYGTIPNISHIGISGMMHGYLVLGENDKLLTPFRTWRNTNTVQAAKELSEKLNFNMPLRWSVSHLYQAIINNEPHVKNIKYLTTLSGYVHYKLTKNKVIGIGDASGIFPIDSEISNYDKTRMKVFNNLLKDKNVEFKFEDILPEVLIAGKIGGYLTEEGVLLLDSKKRIKSGISFCPPEGDAGTGMVATNSIKPNTGNVSAGTSSFVMLVLDKKLKKVYPEIDMVTTPDGNAVAMIHGNNCTTDLNGWMNLLKETVDVFGVKNNKDFYQTLFNISDDCDDDLGGIVSYNYNSGEPIVGLNDGRPIMAKEKENKLSIANFMKAQIYSCVAPLNFGIKIFEDEGVKVQTICGHGGFFATPKIGASAMSAALNAPITVLETANEGGAWGIAILASFIGKEEKLSDYLDNVFCKSKKIITVADETERKRFANYMLRYNNYLSLEKVFN